MISCGKCGYTNPIGNKFCQNCGNKLSENVSKNLSDKTSTDPDQVKAPVTDQAAARVDTASNEIKETIDQTSEQSANQATAQKLDPGSIDDHVRDSEQDNTDQTSNTLSEATTVQILRQPNQGSDNPDDPGEQDDLDNQALEHDRPAATHSPTAPNLDTSTAPETVTTEIDQPEPSAEETATAANQPEQSDPEIVAAKSTDISETDSSELDTEPDPDSVPTVEMENLEAAAAVDYLDRLEPAPQDYDPEAEIETDFDPVPAVANSAEANESKENGELDDEIDSLPPTSPDRQLNNLDGLDDLDQLDNAQSLDNLVSMDENEIPTITGIKAKTSEQELENFESAAATENKATEPETLNQLTRLSYAGLTDVGKQRDHNEDAFWAKSQTIATESDCDRSAQEIKGVFVLCDGMGGHECGEVASRMAIDTIVAGFTPFWQEDSLPGEHTLSEIILTANQAIFHQNEIEQRRFSARMGTTVVLMAVYNQTVAIAHVGDSRIYKITKDEITQITQDHEVANQMIEKGIAADVANARPDAHQLTQALGPRANEQVKPTVQFLTLEQNTLFTLCSDGLSDNEVIAEHWRSHLLPLLSSDADLKDGLANLLALGNKINGHDNLSAIVVRCELDQPFPHLV
jgi:serine/threonine protein phosphatase PrpC